MSDIYSRLQEYFDTMASGFPKTQDGIEIKLLKKLYNEKEAAIFLDMTVEKETAEDAAKRLGREVSQFAEEVEAMAKKGLLYREREDGKTFYCAVPFVVGIMEFNVNRLFEDKELAQLVGIYGMSGLLPSLAAAGEQHMRTIPISKNLVDKWPIATYDDAIDIINSYDIVGVTACTCRALFQANGIRSCDNPIESCIGLGKMAEYYIENKFGREITKEEAIEIIKNSDKQGMVLQTFNGKNQGAICSCCGDCCTMLKSLKMRPNPAQEVNSSYFAEINSEECTGCEVCIDRCQLDAMSMNEDNIAVIDRNRCIGCGLCVTTCPTEAAGLVKKPESELVDPPEHLDAAHRIMERNRNF